jgi:hypothetical protein
MFSSIRSKLIAIIIFLIGIPSLAVGDAREVMERLQITLEADAPIQDRELIDRQARVFLVNSLTSCHLVVLVVAFYSSKYDQKKRLEIKVIRYAA